MSVEPDISISLVNTDNRDLLLACLESLPGAAEGITLQTIVIDNASTDGSAAAVRERFPGAEVVEREQRHGFGANHNEAIRRSTGRYVLILNEDTVLHPGLADGDVPLHGPEPGGRRRRAADPLPGWARAALGLPLPIAGAGRADHAHPAARLLDPVPGRGDPQGRLGVRRGDPRAPHRAGGDRRLRRAAVHLLRGPRPVPAAARRRLRDRLLPARVARALRERDDQRRARAADLSDGAQPGDLHPQAPRRGRRVRGAGA